MQQQVDKFAMPCVIRVTSFCHLYSYRQQSETNQRARILTVTVKYGFEVCFK